jgi:hypothetical protein
VCVLCASNPTGAERRGMAKERNLITNFMCVSATPNFSIRNWKHMLEVSLVFYVNVGALKTFFYSSPHSRGGENFNLMPFCSPRSM